MANNLASHLARRDVYPPDVVFSLVANTPIALGVGKDSITAKPFPTSRSPTDPYRTQ